MGLSTQLTRSIFRLGAQFMTAASLVYLPATSLGQDHDAYLSVNTYTKLNPGQSTLMSQFAGQVRKDTPPKASPDAKPVRIALIYPGLQASDYWRRSVSSFEARLKAAEQPYVLDKYFTKPTIESRKQAAHLAEALDNQPDYLVFTLDAKRHRMLTERVLARGTPKLILQNITTPLKAWNGRHPFLYVGFDHETGSRILANHFIEKTGGKGDFAVVCWSRGYISQMRGATFVKAMQEAPGLSLKAFYYAGTTQEAGRAAALEALSEFEDLKFIYACSTDLALGVASALRERNQTDQVMVNGWGGGSAELKAIEQGELDVTVMRMNDDNGVAMADAIVLDQSKRGLNVPTIYSGDFTLVTKDFSPEDIQAFRARAFRYSGL